MSGPAMAHQAPRHDICELPPSLCVLWAHTAGSSPGRINGVYGTQAARRLSISLSLSLVDRQAGKPDSHCGWVGQHGTSSASTQRLTVGQHGASSASNQILSLWVSTVPRLLAIRLTVGQHGASSASDQRLTVGQQGASSAINQILSLWVSTVPRLLAIRGLQIHTLYSKS